uniref:Kinetochore localized astrin (SPAG5) binding protein n=1 Tax=Saimiri boliviensis boliviensis TaxID=39432 RepID=A0A2K6V450_SAIBB
MAASEAPAEDRVFRTRGLSTECESRPLPPSYRKLPFEKAAADLACDAAVAAEHSLNESDKDCRQDRWAPGSRLCRLVMMTSMSKTVDSLQPTFALSGGQPAQMKATDTATRRNVRKGYKPLSKQKSEEELKEKNQLLEAVNKQLHQKLTETQGELKDLTQKVELLEKFRDNCLASLESKGLDPVTLRNFERRAEAF